MKFTKRSWRTDSFVVVFTR